RGPEIHRPGAALAGIQHVEADVRGDPVEPGAEGRAALEAVQAPPGAQQRLLHGVLGLKRGAEHPVAVGGELRAVLLELLLGGAGGPDGYEGHVTFYVAVPDIEEALAMAESLGGTRVMGPETIMDMIELGQFKDPEGHLIGLVKPLQM